MTCIAGVTHNGHVYLAGDSAGLSGWSLTVRTDPKVFHVGEFVFGFTSSFRMGQVLAHGFTPPVIKGDLYTYMVTEFVDELRAAFKAAGIAKEKNGEESCGQFLVGVKGRLFAIESDYQVGESADGYDAVGCGADLAKGALFALRGCGPAARLKAAMEAAERNSGGVRGPFRYVDTERAA